MNMRKTRVFLDSSVIIAGLASASGGSHKVLALCELGLIDPFLSAEVQNEVLRNIKSKLPKAIDAFGRLLSSLPFTVVEVPEEDIKRAELIINTHDALIMAAAIFGKVDWLLSLDKHFQAVKGREKLDFTIATPGEFLQQFVDIVKQQE